MLEQNNKKQVFLGATIYTQDRQQPKAEALIVNNGKFSFIGSNEEALNTIHSNEAKICSINGKIILPGLIDCHANHLDVTILQCMGNDAVVKKSNQTMLFNKVFFKQCYIKKYLSMLNSKGYTAYLDTGFIAIEEEQILNAIKSDLSLRVFYTITYSKNQKVEPFLEKLKYLQTTYTTDILRFNTLGLIKDGSLWEHKALMHRPYADQPENSGIQYMHNDDMLPMAKEAVKAGFNLHLRATGDKAFSESLDLFQAIGYTKVTKTIAAAQIMPENWIDPFTEQSEVFYQTVPIQATVKINFTEKALGKSRYRRQMPLATINRKRIRLVFGSGSITGKVLQSINPFLQMHCAVNRIYGTRETYFPPYIEALKVETALKAFTINAAKKLGVANEIGSITKGKSADFIIIDKDILKIPIKEIKTIKVLKTYFKGKCVYDGE